MRTAIVILSVLLALAVAATAASGNGAKAAKSSSNASTSTSNNQDSVSQPNGSMQPGMSPAMQPSAISGAGPGMGVAPPMGMGIAHSMAVDDQFIYLVVGGQILKINKETLQLVNSAPIPRPIPPQASTLGTQPGTAMGAGPANGTMNGSKPSVPTDPSTMGAGPGTTSMGAPRPQMVDEANRLQQMSAADFEQNYMTTIMKSHAGAIQMSRLVERNADHSALRQFARALADEESRINRAFSGHLYDWYGVRTTTAMQQPMPMDVQAYNAMQSLSGRNLEIQYMQAMLTHFAEVTPMSQMAAQKATHEQLRKEASDMSRKHSEQSAKIKGWLSSWYGIDAQ